jgi:hypothetical protein
MSAPILLILPTIVVIVVIRVMAGRMDRDRIEQYILGRGGRVMEITWAPLGRGWFGSDNDRIYEIRYRDNVGDEHLAHCKTSMWSGVYLTDDVVVRTARPRESEPPSRETQLEIENHRLREELESFRRKQMETQNRADAAGDS